MLPNTLLILFFYLNKINLCCKQNKKPTIYYKYNVENKLSFSDICLEPKNLSDKVIKINLCTEF